MKKAEMSPFLHIEQCFTMISRVLYKVDYIVT